MPTENLAAKKHGATVCPDIPDSRKRLNPDATIGEALQNARAMSGLTVRQMSERIQLGRSVISDIEHGRRSIKAWELPSIAEAYGLDPMYILQIVA